MKVRVAVTGATGNVGSSLIQVLGQDPDVDEIVGLARRVPDWRPPKTTWVSCDISRDPISAHLTGCTVVVHLAWQIQPSRDVGTMWMTNVFGTDRVLQAIVDSGVKKLVHASSVGAYSEGPKQPVDESWPTNGIPGSSYSWMKAYVERMLDRFESTRPEISVTRLRPALIFKGESATGMRRLFLGPLFPNVLVRPSLVPIVPKNPRMMFQALHASDAAEAYRGAIHSDANGPFNIAADPVIDGDVLAGILSARTVNISPGVIRAAFAAAWHLRLVPSDPGWADLAFGTPLLDPSRAERELGFRPKITSVDAVKDLLDGLRRAKQWPTPPLERASSGAFRYKELLTGMGARDPLAERAETIRPMGFPPSN